MAPIGLVEELAVGNERRKEAKIIPKMDSSAGIDQTQRKHPEERR